MDRPAATGRVRLGLILGLAVVGLAFYAGFQIAQDYWGYWNLSEEAQRVATEVLIGQMQSPAARERIQARARDYGLTFEDKDIQITQQPGAVGIAFRWETSVEIPWYSYPLIFEVSVTSRRSR